MILTIANDEALDSYLSRSEHLHNLGLGQRYGARLNDPWGYSNKVLRFIARLQGWEGCEGFNKLLHNHTDYPRLTLLKDHRDIYYSGGEFGLDARAANLTVYVKSSRVKFCVTCVQEDVVNNGYAYWRRSHQFIEVCAKHNVKLLTACQSCGEPFTMPGKLFTLLWTGCKCGMRVTDSRPQANDDPLELRVSRFFGCLNGFGFHLETGRAVEAIASRLLQRGLNREAWDSQIAPRYQHGFDSLVGGLSNVVDHEKLCLRLKMLLPPNLVDVAMLIFDSFADFVAAAQFNPMENVPVRFTWSNFQTI